jgi:hypothetical protein
MKRHVLHFNVKTPNINISINSYIRQPNKSSFFSLSLRMQLFFFRSLITASFSILYHDRQRLIQYRWETFLLYKTNTYL